MGSKWAIFDFSRFSSQIGVGGHTREQKRQFGQILPFWPFWPRFWGVKIFDFFGSKNFFSKKISKNFSNFFLPKIESEYSKWHFTTTYLLDASWQATCPSLITYKFGYTLYQIYSIKIRDAKVVIGKNETYLIQTRYQPKKHLLNLWHHFR